MSRYDQYSDEELIFRLRQGETEISDYLMEKYKEFVRKKARAMFLIGIFRLAMRKNLSIWKARGIPAQKTRNLL